jgi:hypothetical protein
VGLPDETFLLEVAVEGKRRRDPALAHRDSGDAVGEGHVQGVGFAVYSARQLATASEQTAQG